MAVARPRSTVRTDPGERFNYLVGVVLRLIGPRRVLLLLESDDGRLAPFADSLPAGETRDELLRVIGPWLEEARELRTLSLRHGPAGADPVDQRSCLIVPMLAQRELLA